MKYPYYIVPDIEEYKSLDPSSEMAKELSRKIAANIGDYASLRLVLGIDPPEFARFYPDMETPTPSTFDTIDSFLDKYGDSIPALGYMATQENDPKDCTDEKPGLASEESRGEERVENPQEETLQSLIRSHRYKEAMQLIEVQNLNNPNKSIYFAHQMRFLRKLEALDKFRNQTKG